MLKNAPIWLYPFLLGAIVALAYFPGLSGGFIFDDFPHIIDNQALQVSGWSLEELWRASLSSQAGPLKRPVPMFTLALNHIIAGLDPAPYLITNLAIHIVNSLLVAWLAFLFLKIFYGKAKAIQNLHRITLTAVAAGALWGVHPYNLTSVLYVIQRMNSLAALFSLLAAILYIYFRQAQPSQTSRQALLLAGFFLSATLAIFSKENALLLPLQIAAIEFTLLNKLDGPWKCWPKMRAATLWALAGGIPAFFAYHLFATDWEAAYQFRHFSLSERWLTEQRVLWVYIQQIIMPNITTMGLFLDDFPISENLVTPLTTVLALFGHMGMLMLALCGVRKFPVLSFAILWFYASHLLESTIFPLEIMFEHRNYLASAGPVFAVAYYLTHENITGKIRKIFLVFLAGLTLLFATSTAVRASYFGDWMSYPIYEAEHHPTSNRANFNAGRMLALLMSREPDAHKKQQYFEYALKYFERSANNGQQAIEPMNGLVLLYLLAEKEVPKARLMELQSRLLHSSPGNDGYYIFKGVLEIARLGTLRGIQPAEIDALYEAALNNQKITGQNRAHALMSYAIFQCNLLDNCKKAAELAKQAVETSPGYVEFKMILASFLYNIGNKEQGLTWLKLAQEQDKLGYHADTAKFLQQGATIYWGIEKRKNLQN